MTREGSDSGRRKRPSGSGGEIMPLARKDPARPECLEFATLRMDSCCSRFSAVAHGESQCRNANFLRYPTSFCRRAESFRWCAWPTAPSVTSIELRTTWCSSSWYTGTDSDSETFMTGVNRALNPEKYFIVLTNLLANGRSSSPSNTPAPIDRGRFPKITFFDNVRLQYLLIAERLEIKR